MSILQIRAELRSSSVRKAFARKAQRKSLNYFEAKYKITPHLFGALRWNQQIFCNIDNGTGSSIRWAQDLMKTDFAVGYRFTSHTQLKLQYSFQQETTGPGDAIQTERFFPR